MNDPLIVDFANLERSEKEKSELQAQGRAGPFVPCHHDCYSTTDSTAAICFPSILFPHPHRPTAPNKASPTPPSLMPPQFEECEAVEMKALGGRAGCFHFPPHWTVERFIRDSRTSPVSGSAATWRGRTTEIARPVSVCWNGDALRRCATTEKRLSTQSNPYPSAPLVSASHSPHTALLGITCLLRS